MSEIEILEIFDEYGLQNTQKKEIEALMEICREYNLGNAALYSTIYTI